jgi:hypothetical protein
MTTLQSVANKPVWTLSELSTLRDLAPQGHTDAAIGVVIGKTATAVKRQRQRQGIPGLGTPNRTHAGRKPRIRRKGGAVLEPNTHLWQTGDTVVCAGDPQPMIVVGYAVSGDVVTVYVGEGRRRCPEPIVCGLGSLYGIERRRGGVRG